MHDAALMSGFLSTASDAFDRTVRLHESRLLRVAYRILGNYSDAEDAIQDVFLRLHRHGVIENEAGQAAWLYRVTVNCCFDRTRASRPTAELAEFEAPGLGADRLVQREQEKARLMAALALLPERERAAVVLREIEELSTAEVAAALGTSEVTVRSQISNAMGKLKKIMGGETKHDRR